MKKLACIFLLASISGQVTASGIPTVDVAAIAKTVEEGLTRAKEAAIHQPKRKTGTLSMEMMW